MIERWRRDWVGFGERGARERGKIDRFPLRPHVRKKFLKNYLDVSKAFFISSKEHLCGALGSLLTK